MGRRATISLIELPKRSFCKENARAAVIIGERVKYWPVESLSNRDLAVIAIVIKGGTLFLPNQLTFANRYHVIHHVLCPAEDLQYFCYVLEHY